MNLMASKLAAAGLIEGQITDEGLAAMSDCRDLTSQLAKELTKGIRTEVEDISAIFKRMAILKTDEEKQAFAESKTVLRPEFGNFKTEPPLFDSEAFPAASGKRNTAAVTAQKGNSSNSAQIMGTVENFVFFSPKRIRSQNNAAEDENQLSFFDAGTNSSKSA